MTKRLGEDRFFFGAFVVFDCIFAIFRAFCLEVKRFFVYLQAKKGVDTISYPVPIIPEKVQILRNALKLNGLKCALREEFLKSYKSRVYACHGNRYLAFHLNLISVGATLFLNATDYKNIMSFCNMFGLKKFIGEEVRYRRLSIVMPDNEICVVFCIIESVEDDMQDALATSVSDRTFANTGGEKYAIFESTDSVLSSDVISGWGKEMKSLLIPLHQEHGEDEIKRILPLRNSAAFVRLFSGNGQEGIMQVVENDTSILEQIKILSERFLGYDLSQMSQYWGNTVFICYNPIFKSIDLTEDGKNNGLYFRVNYRRGHKEPLIVDIVGKAKDGALLQKYSFKTEEGVFLSHFQFQENYPLIDIYVKLMDGTLVDYYRDVAFIHKISVNVSIKGEE